MTIKAIETRYAGCRFRSRLEARWAVFFDHLKIGWQYEPEGFELPNGRYLPDFKIEPRNTSDGPWSDPLDLYCEVKGAPLTLPEAEKIRAFAETAGKNRFILALGAIPEVSSGWYGFFTGWGGGGKAARFNLTFYGCIELEQVYGGFRGDTRPASMDSSFQLERLPGRNGSLAAALTAARSARFEHGESGVR